MKKAIREERGVALTFKFLTKANFVPGRLIVNKIKARRFRLAGCPSSPDLVPLGSSPSLPCLFSKLSRPIGFLCLNGLVLNLRPPLLIPIRRFVGLGRSVLSLAKNQ